LKLAHVAARFIKAYSAGEIRLDFETLAITDDQQAQEKVWDSLCHDWERSAQNSILCSPKNTSALPIAARASSALTLMSPQRSPTHWHFLDSQNQDGNGKPILENAEDGAT
jgi:hypothetical protein